MVLMTIFWDHYCRSNKINSMVLAYFNLLEFEWKSGHISSFFRQKVVLRAKFSKIVYLQLPIEHECIGA